MQKYHKIETIFERDTATGKLIPKKYRNEVVEYLKNNIWEFTEKVDGTNIRVCWNGYKISFGGRTENSIIPQHLLNKLEELFSGEIKEQLFEQKFGELEVILYGEGYGEKIQTNGFIENSVDFILFDVMINGIYQPRNNVIEIANYFGIKSVPIVCYGTLAQGIEFVKGNPQSFLKNATCEMEGVVGRPLIELNDRTGNRVIVKIKYKDFKELFLKNEE